MRQLYDLSLPGDARENAALLPFIFVDKGAGGDDLRNFSFHQALGLFRIFHLIANAHGMAHFHQALYILIGHAIRHAAHGDLFIQPAAFFCERQIQKIGNDDGVIKEELVKIPEAIK